MTFYVAYVLFLTAQPVAGTAEATANPVAVADDARMEALEKRLAAAEAALAAEAKARADEADEAEAAKAAKAAAEATETAEAAETAPAPTETPTPTPALAIAATIESYYQWNFNQPDNGITAFRGFDNRHNAFTLSNAAVDAQGAIGDVSGRLTLQIGSTPSTYYLAEPALAGSSSANATSAELWKFLQQAYVGYRLPVLAGLQLQAGLFLSPIGPEGMLVKDNFNFSRSNLFFGLPFYHTGARGTLSFSDTLSTTIAVYNGWNNVVDNNAAKSISVQLAYAVPNEISASLLYFGGHERADDAPEGFAWRHLLDANATITVNEWLQVQVQGNVGAEPNAFGVSSWAAASAATRIKPRDWLAFALRVDGFYEVAAKNDDGEAGRIFWPVDWVTSPTLTMEVLPVDHVSLRLEVRHDRAAGPMFFGDNVNAAGDADRSDQTTLTAGAIAWF